MNSKEFIGQKIRYYRTKNNLTLKQLSEKIDVSISFLSQVERGLSAVSVNTVFKLSNVFNIDINDFLDKNNSVKTDLITRSYERLYLQTSNNYFQYSLCKDFNETTIVPNIVEIFPMDEEACDQAVIYNHCREEYVYVLEGVLHIYIDEEEYVLNPGDCARIPPNHNHGWLNLSNKTVKILDIFSSNNL